LKNSAENKAGFSLFSINEHRLSIGLLVLLLLAGAGYGIWLAVSPLLPESASTEKNVSRNQIGDIHYGDNEWTEAIKVYREILDDDPENGLVILKIAAVLEKQLAEKWAQYDGLAIEPENDPTDAAKAILAEEATVFQSAVDGWNKLLDNARYRHRAMERVACLHSLRFKKLNDDAMADQAIALLEDMLSKGLTTSQGLLRTRSLTPLRDHRQFSRLVREERRISNLNGTSYQNDPGSGY
jgi:tetratricopeptide (TPR) repeat protein